MTHRCEAKVHYGWGDSTTCNKNAKYEHEGKHYCGTHHPPMVKERTRKTNAKVLERDLRIKMERAAREFKNVAERCNLATKDLKQAIEDFQKKNTEEE